MLKAAKLPNRLAGKDPQVRLRFAPQEWGEMPSQRGCREELEAPEESDHELLVCRGERHEADSVIVLNGVRIFVTCRCALSMSEGQTTAADRGGSAGGFYEVGCKRARRGLFVLAAVFGVGAGFGHAGVGFLQHLVCIAVAELALEGGVAGGIVTGFCFDGALERVGIGSIALCLCGHVGGMPPVGVSCTARPERCGANRSVFCCCPRQ